MFISIQREMLSLKNKGRELHFCFGHNEIADSPPDDLNIVLGRAWDSRFEGARDQGMGDYNS